LKKFKTGLADLIIKKEGEQHTRSASVASASEAKLDLIKEEVQLNKYGIDEEKFNNIIRNNNALKEIERKVITMLDKKETFLKDLQPHLYPTLPKQSPALSRASTLSENLDFVDSVMRSQINNSSMTSQMFKSNTKQKISRHELTSLKIQKNIQKYNSPQIDTTLSSQSIFIATQKLP